MHPDFLIFADNPRFGFHPAGEVDSLGIISDETDLFYLRTAGFPEGLDGPRNAHLVGWHIWGASMG